VFIKLGVVCIRVWCEMMTFDELQQVGSVEEKQDWSKDRTLRGSRVDCRWHRTGRRCVNLLCSAAEVRRKAVDDLLAKAVRRAQPLKERVMVDAAADRSSRVSITRFPESSADKMPDRTLRMAVSVE